MALEIWVNTGSGNHLLPDDTKSLPEPMLTDKVTINKMLWHSFQDDIDVNIQDSNPQFVFTIHKFEIRATSPRPGGSELTHPGLVMP